MSIHLLPPPRPMALERREAIRAVLEDMVAADFARSPRWWHRRWLTGFLGAAVFVMAGAGTAAAYSYLHPRAVTNHSSARCYTTASQAYSGSPDFPGTSIAVPDGENQKGQVAKALDVCAAMWRAGILQPDAPAPIVHPGASFFPVPALVGCTLSDGTAAVFPGDANTCERLGLAAQSPPAIELP